MRTAERRARRAAPWAVLALLAPAGCAVVGPDYQRPEVPLPAAWHAPLPALLATGQPVRSWWQLFGDAHLDDLVSRALSDNLEVAVAASRVREARAVARGVDAERAWQLDAGARVDVAAEHRSRGGDSGVSGSVTAFGESGLDLDLFGGLARGRQSAAAAAERELALLQEARRLTTAEVARNYVRMRAAQTRLVLTRESLALQRQTLNLVSERVKAGLAPRLDEVRAQASVATLEADVGPLQTQVGRFRDALAVLLGVAPGELVPADSAAAAIPVARAGGPLPVPAELLRRRPDVRAAELAIIGATADVGVATAELYPSLTLPGRLSVGRSGIGAGALVSTVIASLSPVLSLPLLDGGGRQADVNASRERVVQAALGYRRTLLNALLEVEAALLEYQGTALQRAALATAVENNRVAFTQSQALYRQGLTTFIDVLDSQRELNRSLQSLAEAERDLALDVVELHSALGGADHTGEVPPAPS